MTNNTAQENSEWFVNQNLAEYLGLWVAVVNRVVVAKGSDPQVVIAAARKKAPNAIPFIASVPEGTVTV